MVESDSIKIVDFKKQIVGNDTIVRVKNYEYNESNKIAQGPLSILYRGVDLHDATSVAFKVFCKNELFIHKTQEAFTHELHILKTISLEHNQNIVKYLDSFQTQNDFYIVMEFCEEGTLNELIQKNPVVVNLQIILQLLSEIVNAYKTLHSLQPKIIHRDLKPSNIFIAKLSANSNQIQFKLGDFGISKEALRTLQTASLPGTFIYCSPEILTKEKEAYNSDIWSLGIILYEMATGKLPFDLQPTTSVIEIKDYISKSKFMIPSDLPEYLIILLKRMLVVDPSKRIQWKELFELFPTSEPPEVKLTSELISLNNSNHTSNASSISNHSFEEIKEKVSEQYVFALKYLDKLLIYDLQKKIPETHQINLPQLNGRSIYGIGDSIYLIGGCKKDTQQFQPSTYKYSISSNQILQLADMKIGKAAAGISYIHHLYAIAGKTNHKKLVPECEEYDIQNNRWKSINSLNHPKSFVGATSDHSNFIYVFGGNLGKNYSNSIERFATLGDRKWVPLSLINQEVIKPVFIPGVVYLSNENSLLVFGGRIGTNDQNYCSLIDLKTMKATQRKQIPINSSFFSNPAFEHNSKIFVLNAKGTELLTYNINQKIWEREIIN